MIVKGSTDFSNEWSCILYEAGASLYEPGQTPKQKLLELVEDPLVIPDKDTITTLVALFIYLFSYKKLFIK